MAIGKMILTDKCDWVFRCSICQQPSNPPHQPGWIVGCQETAIYICFNCAVQLQAQLDAQLRLFGLIPSQAELITRKERERILTLIEAVRTLTSQYIQQYHDEGDHIKADNLFSLLRRPLDELIDKINGFK